MEQTPDHETDLSLRQVSDRHGIELHFLFTKKPKIDRSFQPGELTIFIEGLIKTFWSPRTLRVDFLLEKG